MQEEALRDCRPRDVTAKVSVSVLMAGSRRISVLCFAIELSDECGKPRDEQVTGNKISYLALAKLHHEIICALTHTRARTRLNPKFHTPPCFHRHFHSSNFFPKTKVFSRSSFFVCVCLLFSLFVYLSSPSLWVF